MTFGETVAASLITSFATAAVFGILAAYYTTWLAFKRYKLEKWWDKKASAYETILSDLFDYMLFFEIVLEGHITDNSPLPKTREDLQNKSEEAHRRLRKSSKIGSFIISNKAEMILVSLDREIDKAIESQDWLEFIERTFDASSRALNDFRDEARNDLSLEPALPLAQLIQRIRRRAMSRAGHPDLGAPSRQ